MKIPVEYMQEAIDNWVQYGTPAPSAMGSFLRALLRNDLRAAAMNADDRNRVALAEWAMYLHNEVPSACWGSAAALDAWHEMKASARRGGEAA